MHLRSVRLAVLGLVAVGCLPTVVQTPMSYVDEAPFAVTSAAALATATASAPTRSARAWRPIWGTRAAPAHWGTCTISYHVNPRGMPAFGMADLGEALRRVSEASGILFRYAGSTSAVPRPSYGGPGLDRMLVAWATPTQSRGLLTTTIGGVGGSSHTLGGRILSGYLVVNTQFSKRANAGFGAGSPHGMILMHEIGHVVGLDHVEDPTQVMHPSAALPTAAWGEGDVAGLRRLGRVGGCH